MCGRDIFNPCLAPFFTEMQFHFVQFVSAASSEDRKAAILISILLFENCPCCLCVILWFILHHWPSHIVVMVAAFQQALTCSPLHTLTILSMIHSRAIFPFDRLVGGNACDARSHKYRIESFKIAKTKKKMVEKRKSHSAHAKADSSPTKDVPFVVCVWWWLVKRCWYMHARSL